MSLATLIKTDAAANDLLNEASAFGVLPAGPYEFTIKQADIVDFGKDPKWDGFKALNVQLRVIDGAPRGAGRVFFLRVPLFQRFLPTAKNPAGAAASDYFNFFLALGFSKEEVAAGNVSLEGLGGKRIGASLVVKEPNQWNPEKFNEVSNPRAPKAIEGVREAGQSAVGSAFTPAAAATPAASPWAATAPAAAPQGDSALQAAAESKGAF